MTDSPSHPSLVMIIRHGEKPGNPGDDKNGGKHLSLIGSARAAALPSLFIPGGTPVAGDQQLSWKVSLGSSGEFVGSYRLASVSPPPSRFSTPKYLFATASSTASHRPLETLTPLAQALQSLNDPTIDTVINSNFANNSKDIQTLADTVLQTPVTYGGKVVLICWHHGTIPELARDFGVSESQLSGWDPFPSSVFDVVMQITWSGAQPTLLVQYQQLLFGDTADTLKILANAVE